MSAPRREREVRRVLWVTLGLNLAVSIAKLVVGMATSTLSLVADGYHSLLDGAGNVFGLVALRAAHKPPDEDHPFGHRKFEVLASMGISILLFATAAEIVIESARRFRGSTPPDPTWLTIVTAIATLGVNLFVTTWESRQGRRLRSPFLLADAQHTLSDIFATLGVLAAILLIRAGAPWADPFAALAIAGVIVRAGWRILNEGVDIVADRRVIDASAIESVVLAFPGVRACERIRTRGFSDAAFLDLSLRLDPDLSLREAHDLCDRIEERLHARFPQVTDIVIHPEPEEASPAAPGAGTRDSRSA